MNFQEKATQPVTTGLTATSVVPQTSGGKNGLQRTRNVAESDSGGKLTAKRTRNSTNGLYSGSGPE